MLVRRRELDLGDGTACSLRVEAFGRWLMLSLKKCEETYISHPGVQFDVQLAVP